jgi:hypothetical protein
VKWVHVFEFLLGSTGDAVPRLGRVRPHRCDFHGFIPVKHRSNPNFFAFMLQQDGETPAGVPDVPRRWRRAVRIGVPFVVLLVWVVAAVGLVVWAASL